jgi:hypothetical protein
MRDFDEIVASQRKCLYGESDLDLLGFMNPVYASMREPDFLTDS